MQLLSFSVQNHKSIRDEAVLDFTVPSLKSLRPTGDWRDHIYPVLGIFGPNASGKSTVLDALTYVVAAIRDSASKWLAEQEMPRAAFRLDSEHPNKPSRYELSFVHGDQRYEYGFEIAAQGIVREWLCDVPNSRRRALFRRKGAETRYAKGIRTIGPLASRELLLSRALRLEHEKLAPLARLLLDNIEIVPLGETYRHHRIQAIIDDLFTGTSSLDTIESILQIADVGVARVALREDQVPPEYLAFVKRLHQFLSQEIDGPQAVGQGDLSSEDAEAIIREIAFHHHGCGDSPFTLRDESDGTLAWLALAAPALRTIRDGGLFVVDEIDASLHSHLVEVLVGFFLDPDVNSPGAQLLFTSHDTFLLSPLSNLDLKPGQVWFTEKERDGATELFSLADFPHHSDENVAKRYLTGRYGAIPTPAPSLVHGLLDSEALSA